MSWKTIIRPKGWLAVGQNKFEIQCSNKRSRWRRRNYRSFWKKSVCNLQHFYDFIERIYIYIYSCSWLSRFFEESIILFDVKCHDEINLNCIMQWTTRGMVWLIPRKVKYQPALKISSREGEVQAENLICRFGRHFVQWITNYLLLSETLWKQLFDFLTFR